ncbi:MAG: DNA polymerase III subunit alpha [Planctomycetota bacterium]|nr:DNA polymerase III subunit alpha [Planctomycetota bacterium]
MPVDFCHLHTHTQYSLLDGASRIGDLIKRAQKMNQKALAITDHGNMFGAIEFYKACSDANKAAEKEGKPTVKPILGMEAYIVPDGRGRATREKIEGEYDHHCLLWAADNDGFKNLMKLSTAAYTEGFYMHPRVDREILAAHAKGVIASSGCLGSEVPQTILKKDYEAARKVAGIFLEIFGKENFYFEVQNQAGALAASYPSEDAQELARAQKKVNEAIIKLAKELGGTLIATNDSHYTSREDAQAHDALLCIGTGKLIGDANRLKFACDEFYLKSTDEMRQLFPDLPEALNNTLQIAERCNLKLKFGEYHYPNFPIPNGEDADVFFRRQVEEGLKWRFGPKVPSEVKSRAEEELRVLLKMGFVGYLLIVWDIIREARARGIPVGPGRGSAAGSLVCYALGITNLDPLKYNLLFERFVNEGRNEMPDIDIDFCQSRRGEIIEYVQDKYGRDCTAGIITFNSMAAKGAIRDLGRVMDWPLSEVDKIAKLIPNAPGKKVTLQPRKDDGDAIHVIDDEPDLKNLYESDDRVRTLVDTARRIEGLARNPGRHAAGLVIADKPVTEYCPLYRDKDGALLTQFEMSHIDSVGLLKIDFLGLQTLTELSLACSIVKQRHGTDVDLSAVPLDDMKTYRMLHRGEAKGIFQFESEGMVKLLTEARPDCLEDLTALNAMYRPGPMQNIPAFVGRKHGREPIDYMIPQLEPILKETYGIIVYQEQVMQIANILAGFTLSEADSLRKAMGKKKKDLMEKYGAQFVDGCAKNGIAREKAQALYDLIAKFAEYGFNKSHAAAYAFVAYQTAWLKANYTAEYMAGLLSLRQGNTDDMVMYIDEARRIGLQIAGPDVNASGIFWQIEPDGKTLRFSLGAVKGVGEKAVECIVAAREKEGAFKDIYDFCERVDAKAANKGCIESLIKAGAFDAVSDEGGRAQLMAALEDAIAHGANLRRDRESGQGSLFGGDGEAARPKLPQVAEWPDQQRLEEEKKVLGFYFSGHPLADVREIIEGLSSKPLKQLVDVTDGFEVVAGAYVNSIRATVTREKGEKMAVLTIEDFSGTAQAVVFPRVYDKYKEFVKTDVVLFFRGKIKNDDRGVSLLVEEIFNLEEAVRRHLSAIQITLRQDQPAPRKGHAVAKKNGNGNGNGKKSAKGNGNGNGDAHPAELLDDKAMIAQIESLVGLLRAHPGAIDVWFQLELEEGTGAPATVLVRGGNRVRVKPTPGLFAGLHEQLPVGAIRVAGQNNKPRRPPEPQWKRRG